MSVNVNKVLTTMRQRMRPPERNADGFPVAVCLEGKVLTTCYDLKKQIQHVVMERDSETGETEIIEKACSRIPLEIWRRLEVDQLRRELLPPRIFIPRVNTHGITCQYGGVQHYLRFRCIFKELVEKTKEDRPLIQLLDLAGIVTSYTDDGKIIFDFRALPQTGLMFRKGKKKLPVPDMVLTVKPLKRKKWEMVEG
jgi:hypothetical protein